MQTFETRFDTIVMHVWERWTGNGSCLDADDIEQTIKSVRDAATNTYVESMSDQQWYDATLMRLEAVVDNLT